METDRVAFIIRILLFKIKLIFYNWFFEKHRFDWIQILLNSLITFIILLSPFVVLLLNRKVLSNEKYLKEAHLKFKFIHIKDQCGWEWSEGQWGLLPSRWARKVFTFAKVFVFIITWMLTCTFLPIFRPISLIFGSLRLKYFCC